MHKLFQQLLLLRPFYKTRSEFVLLSETQFEMKKKKKETTNPTTYFLPSIYHERMDNLTGKKFQNVKKVYLKQLMPHSCTLHGMNPARRGQVLLHILLKVEPVKRSCALL